MGFTEAIQTCFSKYATFSGRARRSEYWYFFLCYAILSGILSFLARNSTVFTYVSGIVEIALFIPMLAKKWILTVWPLLKMRMARLVK